MPAYVVVEVDVHDRERYDRYKELAPPSIYQYGGRYIARGGACETLEGDWHPPRFVILEFSIPRGVLGRLYRLYFTRVLPVLGGIVSGSREAYAYLPASVDRFDTPEALGERLTRAGFARVTKQPLSGGIAHLVSGEKSA